jgi:hypothetical protein
MMSIRQATSAGRRYGDAKRAGRLLLRGYEYLTGRSLDDDFDEESE